MPDPPGPPMNIESPTSVTHRGLRWGGHTRIHEESPLLIWHGGIVLDEGETSLAGGGVEIIHRNFIISATEVSIWVYYTEVGTVSPSEVRVDWILSTVRSTCEWGTLLGS